MGLFKLNWHEPLSESCRGGAITIGNFDGVHLGHLALLSQARAQAQPLSGPVVAVSFDPHPMQLLRPEQFQPVLTTPPDRAALLQANGADHVVLLQTTRDLLELSAEQFFREVIEERFRARALVEGPDFGFGKNREGNVATLDRFCRPAGIALTIVPPVMLDGQVVSSSRVRHALTAGNVGLARAYLGRPYRLHGIVGTGQRRGRTLGFPTANLEQIETLVPGDGVYAVRVEHRSRIWPGAANVGPNPTFGENARKVEVHLIDFQGELVGQQLAVDFVERLRDTRPFSGVEALVGQLRADVEHARRIAENPRTE
jgi:riboflavin kinase/FMN adenylyltransferase